jgi:ATP-dependent Clp protease protease subunit
MTNKRSNRSVQPLQSISPISEAHDHDIIVSTREIFLHGYGDDEEDAGVDYRSSNRFLKNLKILESINNKPITIHQYSIGGEWESGMMIYDAIQQSAASFIFICHGIAASMGSIVPQAVHNKGVRLTMPNCYWLIHEGEQAMSGTVKQFQSYYEFSRLSKFQMYDIYTEVCHESSTHFKNMTKSKVRNFIKRKLESKEDWWLVAEDAIKYGFVDGILGSEKYKSIGQIRRDLV